MKKKSLLFLTIGLALYTHHSIAQNAFYNVINLPGSSDHTGSSVQPGTEVLHSTLGEGVIFESEGTFEHVGQFYVAKDGIWNQNNRKSSHLAGIDYFGYAPNPIGNNLAYQGIGIKGASPANGGSGAGRPIFGHIQLNSTDNFPVVGGMYIAHSLTFNANGPGKPNTISTPNCSQSDRPENAVVFSPAASISGAGEFNFIDGYASVTDVTSPFSLPLGDPADITSPFHPLTVNKASTGTITGRYLRDIRHSSTELGLGVAWVSSIGTWPISAPDATNVTVRIPALSLNEAQASNLRLVGWDGGKWVDLSGQATPGACTTGECPLTGTLLAGITDLAIGLITSEYSGSPDLTLWPNPTKGYLSLRVLSNFTISEIRVLDLQGHILSRSVSQHPAIDASMLPTSTYMLEVLTTQGQRLRKRFIKQ